MEDSPPDINNNEQAHRRRKLLGIINSLRSLGFNEHLRLPQMVCVGSQSVGKSSVIEALAQINLPRDSGTCTRCPIECRLKHTPGNAWQAQVLLRFETDDTRRSGEIAFGDLITDRLALQDRIMRAQKAVLQPTIPSSNFLNEDLPNAGSSFTRSCVVVELSGEDLTDLTFIDLPGLIANSSDAMTDNDIQLVEDLVSSYISDLSSLILLVVSCETDFETHRSVHLARKHDPNGARTIGVLTKPDRIPPDEEENWIEMIAGRSNRLQNGWYVVKQPTRGELRSSKHTWARARAREQEFFESTPAWAPILQQFQEKFGTRRLGDQLGNVLARNIQDMLPSILEEINRLIRENEAELGKLPKPLTGSARAMVRVLLDGFLRKVNLELVRGNALARNTGLIQQMHGVYRQMRDDLQGAALVFRPNEAGAELPAPSFLPEDEPWLPKKIRNEMTLEMVAKDAEQVRTREFVDDVTFELKKDYISKVVEGWTQPTMSALEDVYDRFCIILTKLINEEFHAYRDGQLDVMVGNISTQIAELCKSEASTHLSALLEQEGEPYTVHEDQFRTYKRQFLQYYKGVCYPRAMSSGLQATAEGSSNPGGSGISQTPSSSQDSAIEIMASTRAHYQIAYRRFCDNVPMTIDQYFIRGFGKQISFAIYEGLRPKEGDSEQYYESLLRESNSDRELRRVLMAKRAKLYAARREII